jgi:hypothetical protein
MVKKDPLLTTVRIHSQAHPCPLIKHCLYQATPTHLPQFQLRHQYATCVPCVAICLVGMIHLSKAIDLLIHLHTAPRQRKILLGKGLVIYSHVNYDLVLFLSASYDSCAPLLYFNRKITSKRTH